MSSTEIVAAIDLYVRNPMTGRYRFASGHSLDIGTAVAGSTTVYQARANPGPEGKAYRNAVTAVVMAAQALPPKAG